MLEHHANDGDPVGAHRHADADFAPAPRHRPGHHAVNPRQRQRQAQQPHAADQRRQRGENPGRSLANVLFDGAQRNHRLVGIDGFDHVAERLRQTIGGAGRCDKQGHLGAEVLRKGQIEELQRRLDWDVVLAVPGQAYHLDPVAFRPAQAKPFTDGILAGPISFREALVDYRHARRTRRIGLQEPAAQQNRNVRRAKITVADHILTDMVNVCQGKPPGRMRVLEDGSSAEIA